MPQGVPNQLEKEMENPSNSHQVATFAVLTFFILKNLQFGNPHPGCRCGTKER